MKKRDIPFFNYPHIFKEHDEDYSRVLTETCRRGAYIMQQELFEFEKQLGQFLGVKHVLGTADGTMALMMALKAVGIKPGDEVIVPTHTFVATAAAVDHVGAKPVLVDCARDHLIDADDVKRKITKRTRAIMPVQLNGRTANMEPVTKLAQNHNLVIVEDSCQALGSKFKNKFAGTFGAAGAFSFYPSKTLGCFGDGGAVITNDDEVATILKLLRDHGRGDDGKVWMFGYNSRLDNIQAAILLLKLKRYPEAIAKRRALAMRYQNALKDIKEVLLPPAPDADDAHFDIYQNYEIEAENREKLRFFLEENGIKTIIQWGGHLIHQFEKLGLNTDVPYAEAMSKKYMLLPMHTALTDDDVDYVCEKIVEFYKK
ncbi:DegT/DnrJ/EryC1/StrS family aminotransferase [bacterium]|nr:DegT/DnrJ/EryC1/StrS family aminotransferase [bacterium]